MFHITTEGKHTVSDHDLEDLMMAPVILLEEFFASIKPIAAIACSIPEEERHDFYMSLLPRLIGHCRTAGLPQPHETALFVVRLVEEAVAATEPPAAAVTAH
jgi:hypothetical protein